MGWILMKSLEPPSRMKTRTTKPFEPVSVGDPLTRLDRFLDTNANLGRLITRATGLATNQVKVVSPFNPHVTYNAYAALGIVLVHARRHLWQAAQAKIAA